MKKYIIFLIGLFLLPLTVNAESLLNSLVVDGIGELNIDKREWNLTFSTTLDYIDIKAEAKDGVDVFGDGRKSFEDGLNIYRICATNGDTTEVYVLNIKVNNGDGVLDHGEPKIEVVEEVEINLEDKKEDKKEKIVKTFKDILPIILLICGAIIVLCVIVFIIINN